MDAGLICSAALEGFNTTPPVSRFELTITAPGPDPIDVYLIVRSRG